MKKIPLLLAFLVFQAQAGTNWFQDGMTYGQGQLNQAGNAQTLSTAGQTAITNLNQGTNLVQPNSTEVTTMQGYGVQGNSSGTGLGSFGTSNVNTCAGYVIGTGGPARDAECNAVGFASQTTNLNAQANSAYGITGQSSFLQNAINANAGATANMNNLLPPTVTSVSGTTNCVSQPTVAATPTTQSCYIYNTQSTSGGAVTTWNSGSTVSVTCTGSANLSNTTCTINPPVGSVSASCISTSQNSSSGTPESYGPGSQAPVTCTGGSVLTSNNCTVSPPIQTTSSTMCYSQQQTGSTGTSADYMPGSSIAVNCTAPANLTNTNCSVTTPLAAQTTSQSCQISVPATKTCNIIYGANVGSKTVQNCVSGNYPIYDGGCAWGGFVPRGGFVPNWYTHSPIGYAAVTCTGQYTFSLTVNVSTYHYWRSISYWRKYTFSLGESYWRGESLSPNGPFPVSYSLSASTLSTIIVGSRSLEESYSVAVVNVTWDGVSAFYFGGSNGSGAWCGHAQIPMSSTTVPTFGPTVADGCTPYGG